MNLGPYELDQIYTGDARELSKAIPDESIDLVFCDPVYDRIDDYRWLAETAARVLKQNTWLLCYYATKLLPETISALKQNMIYEWQHINYMPTLNAFGAYRTFCNYRGCLRFKKGAPIPRIISRDLVQDGYNHKNNGHEWAKNLDVISNWMQAYSGDAAIVFDPFTGGGTVPAVCKMLGRHYLAFEIMPDVAERARQRVQNTQPPLFVMQPEQAALELEIE